MVYSLECIWLYMLCSGGGELIHAIIFTFIVNGKLLLRIWWNGLVCIIQMHKQPLSLGTCPLF